MFFGDFERREIPASEIQLDIDRVGDLLAARYGMFEALEALVHFRLGPQEELVVVHPHAVAIRPEFTRADAHQDILDLGVLAFGIVGVVGGHQGQTHPVGDVDRTEQLLALDRYPIVHDLDEVPVFEELGKPSRDVLSLLDRSCGIRSSKYEPGKFARHASAQADNPLAVEFEQLLVDSRFVVEAFEVGARSKADQIAKTGLILSKKRQVVGSLFRGVGIARVSATRGDVSLIADDGVDSRCFGLFVELQGPVQVTVVGKCQGVHSEIFGPLDQSIDRPCSVEKGVMAMAMKVNKWPIERP